MVRTRSNSYNIRSLLFALVATSFVSCGGESKGGMSDLPTDGECTLSSGLQWTASDPIITSPVDRSDGTLYSPTIVQHESTFHVFATVEHPWTQEFRSVFLSFDNWIEASLADPMPLNDTPMGDVIAPQVFYFRPQNQWYMISDSNSRFATSADISDPNAWTPMQPLLENETSQPLWIDQWVICDESHCYLFFVDVTNASSIAMSKTPIENFPNFPAHETVIDSRNEDGTLATLFLGPSVYKIAGQEHYLLLASKRFSTRNPTASIAAWYSTSLDGPWQPLGQEDNTFASATTVEWPDDTQWADGIYDGELLRQSADERQLVDPCHLQFLFNGDTGPYIPNGVFTEVHKVGLLTPKP